MKWIECCGKQITVNDSCPRFLFKLKKYKNEFVLCIEYSLYLNNYENVYKNLEKLVENNKK